MPHPAQSEMARGWRLWGLETKVRKEAVCATKNPFPLLPFFNAAFIRILLHCPSYRPRSYDMYLLLIIAKLVFMSDISHLATTFSKTA